MNAIVSRGLRPSFGGGKSRAAFNRVDYATADAMKEAPKDSVVSVVAAVAPIPPTTSGSGQ